MSFNFPNTLSSELKETIKGWAVSSKSPYSYSYYSADDIGWDYKPDKSYRVSDHWNFTCRKNKKHCQTTEDCPNNTHWSLGIFDASLGKYIILKSCPKLDKGCKESLLLALENKKERAAIEIGKRNFTPKVHKRVLASLELNILNSYFKTLQKF